MKTTKFSAYIEDMRLDELPEGVQADVLRFVDAKAHHKFVHYGMVVKELLPKADPANLKTARARVKKLTERAALKEVLAAVKKGDKYILLVNDRIVDGHHFVAKAERGRVTSSLNVLDLTPARFQFRMKPLTGSIVQFSRPDFHERPKNQRSGWRTAAMVAGGAGVAYGGLKIGQAANQARKAAAAVEEVVRHTATTAENAAAITGGIRRAGRAVAAPFRAVKRAVLFSSLDYVPFEPVILHSSLRKDPIEFFAKQSVAVDRYRKQIYEKETDRASTQYTRSAIAGAGLGLAIRRPGITRARAAAHGAAAGVITQTAVRAGTATTKDQYGDRAPKAKLVDKAVPAVIGAAALLAGRKRLHRKAAAAQAATRRAARSAPRLAIEVGGAAVKQAIGLSVAAPRRPIYYFASRRTKALLHGGALAGGIAAADALTSAAMPDKRQTRGEAAKHGLVKGAIYGTGLALAEPAIYAALRRAVRRRKVAMSARTGAIEFGGRQQLRDAGNRFVDPLEVASGTARAYRSDASGVQHPVDLPVGHAQVVRAAINRGEKIQRYGRRATGLVRDAVDVVSGKPKEPGRKREWEKSWFKNAAGTAAIGAGLLTHAHVMRRNPLYRAKVTKTVRAAKRQANAVVPDLFPMSARNGGGNLRFQDVRSQNLGFDVTAPDWDVRDQRGRSARVFAPGAKPRQRREKYWHEKADNQRKIAVAGALVAAGAGLAGGKVIGQRIERAKAISGLQKLRRRFKAPGGAYDTSKVVPFRPAMAS